MNIIYDARAQQHDSPTGVGIYVRQLALSLLATDIARDIRFFESGTTKTAGIFPHDQTISIRIPNKLLNAAIMLVRRPRLAELSKLPKNTPLCIPNINFIAIPKTTPYVIVVHDLSFIHHPEWFSPTVALWHKAVRPRELIVHATKIICVSHATAEDVKRTLNISASRIEVIYPGISSTIQPISHTKKSSFQKPYILYIGSIEPRKNLTTLFQAFENLKSQPRFDDLQLVIAGTCGYDGHNILKKMLTASWKNNAHYLGYVDDIEKQNLMRHASVFVYPSFFEGFGFPPLEAMACGTPVVASWSTSLKETLTNNALLFNPHRSDELAFALEGLLTDVSLHQYFRSKGLEHVHQFRWEKTAQQTSNILSSFLQ